MKFKIDEKIFEQFPNLVIGLIHVRGMNNQGKSNKTLELLKEEQKRIQQEFSKEELSQDSKISCWREAYSSFGAKPKKYKCSVENLYRMILDGVELGHINTIVDIYNYISLKHIIPVGGDDLNKVEGDITLTYAKGDEIFVQLKNLELKNPKEGEVVYKDSKEILCRRWNWRECDKSKMTEDTKNAVLVVEGLAHSKEEVNEILSEFAGLIQDICGGEITSNILDKNNSEVEL